MGGLSDFCNSFGFFGLGAFQTHGTTQGQGHFLGYQGDRPRIGLGGRRTPYGGLRYQPHEYWGDHWPLPC